MKKLFGYGMMGGAGMNGGSDFGMIGFFHWIISVGILVWLIVGMLLIIYLWKLVMKR